MAEITINSTLSNEETKANFKNAELFTGIMSGLEEALAFEKGSAKAATIVRKRSLPDVNAVELRKALNLTQKEFAKILGVSPRTIEAWESGRTTPSPTAKNLLYLISLDNSLIQKLK